MYEHLGNGRVREYVGGFDTYEEADHFKQMTIESTRGNPYEPRVKEIHLWPTVKGDLKYFVEVIRWPSAD